MGCHFLVQRIFPIQGSNLCLLNWQADSFPTEPPQKLCPTVYNPVDHSPPGSIVLGILQARILEWVAMPSSRGSSQPRNWTQVSCIAGRFFTIWATRKAWAYVYLWLIHVDVWQKPKQYCKAIILQLKINKYSALEWPWGMGLGGQWKGDSGWRTHVHPWLIHVNVWQNHYSI